MTKANPKLKVAKPKRLLAKSVTFDFKGLFKAIGKGITHGVIGKWEELGSDAVEALSSIGLTTHPEELAHLLVRRAAIKATFDLIGESASQLLAESKIDEDSLTDRLDLTIAFTETAIDSRFLDRPAELDCVAEFEDMVRRWLTGHNLTKPAAESISSRFSSYFVFAINQEWRRNSKAYAPLLDAINTPFTKAGEREWAWATYASLLERRINESVFDESFSLNQIFVPLNAYYVDESPDSSMEASERHHRDEKRVVISLEEELTDWLRKARPEDTIRVVSGGPGSGKSSFFRVFAARIARESKTRVLFIPLHLIDPTKDLVAEVNRFASDEGVLSQSPLDPNDPEPDLLIIFDGLDELASQGKASAETARAFIGEVERTVGKRNLQSVRLRVLISGREVVVQENKTEFRRPRQVLNLLPYFMPGVPKNGKTRHQEQEEYSDPRDLLKQDLRQVWWKKYGKLKGKRYEGLPEELRRPDLDEITSQPLLNYLVSLSLSREKLDFSKNINLNSIYADLVAAVHERGYEKRRMYTAIRHMSTEEFARILEEIGLAAWHGDGRTTTVREIEDHCRVSGLERLLNNFREGAEAGVTRLLAAFFFRQHGQRPSGDHTFVFTHKSFGEYLAAKRIVRAVDRLVKELDARSKDPDGGWSERDALKHWAQICGPSPMSEYLLIFARNELALRPPSELSDYQIHLVKLFNFMLQHGIPMEQLQQLSFKETLFQARNAEEALLVLLSSCASLTQVRSKIEQPDPATFGAWFKRIQGQRLGPAPSLAALCLSHLDIAGAKVDIADFYGANLQYSQFRGIAAHFAVFCDATLMDFDAKNGQLSNANFQGAYLMRADFRGANLAQADFRHAKLDGAKFQGADLFGALFLGDGGGGNFDGGSLKVHKERGEARRRVRAAELE